MNQLDSYRALLNECSTSARSSEDNHVLAALKITIAQDLLDYARGIETKRERQEFIEALERIALLFPEMQMLLEKLFDQKPEQTLARVNRVHVN